MWDYPECDFKSSLSTLYLSLCVYSRSACEAARVKLPKASLIKKGVWRGTVSFLISLSVAPGRTAVGTSLWGSVHAILSTKTLGNSAMLAHRTLQNKQLHCTDVHLRFFVLFFWTTCCWGTLCGLISQVLITRRWPPFPSLRLVGSLLSK